MTTDHAADPAGPVPPRLDLAFTARVEVGTPIELGAVDHGRERFIPILGGTVDGPRLQGTILAAGGDWQTLRADGRTDLLARYLIRAADGTVISLENAGMRVAPPEVLDRIARGEQVASGEYYSAGTPRFSVMAGPHDWLRRRMFVARGIRRPTRVELDFYTVE